MPGINQAFIAGKVGRDAEVRYSQDGMAIANFSVATSEKYNGKENTEWHNIVCFKKLAEIVGEYVHKGMDVAVMGKLKTNSWEKDGVKHYRTEILANQVQFMGGRQQNQQQQVPNNTPQDDDIPF